MGEASYLSRRTRIHNLEIPAEGSSPRPLIREASCPTHLSLWGREDCNPESKSPLIRSPAFRYD